MLAQLERERERRILNLNLTETRTNSIFLNSTDDILKPTSPLFAPIDSLDEILFSTNSCEFLPKLYGIWKSVNDIDFDKLPNAFALKTNHDCGGVVLVPDKQSFLANKQVFDKSMQKLKEHLATNYYELYREWHYKDIEPRVFAEELLGVKSDSITNSTAHNPNLKQSIENDDFQGKNSAYHSPNNYRIFAFPNQKMFIQVDDAEYDISHKRWFYDENWVFQPFSYNMPVLNDEIAKPQNLEAMKNTAQILAYDFARVDLYEVNSHIFVGELTMTPVGGSGRFTPSEWDKRLGEM